MTVSFDELELSSLYRDDLDQAEEDRMIAALMPEETTPYMAIAESSEEEVDENHVPTISDASDAEAAQHGEVAKLVEEVLGIPSSALSQASPTETQQALHAGAASDSASYARSAQTGEFPAGEAQQQDAYSPVMETWANVPTHEQDPGGQAAELPSGVESSEYSQVAVDEQVAVVTQPEVPSQTVPDADVDLATIAPTAPTEYEVTLAERLLKTEFGDRVRQLGNHITGHLPENEPQVVLVAGIDVDPQRPDAVAGLGLLICAQRTEPTLIVDADLDSSLISHGLEKSGQGISEIMNGAVSWKQTVRPTSCSGLHLIPSGSSRDGIATADANLIGQIIEAWKQSYGLILVDGGLTESPLVSALAPHADATFVSVHLGTSQREKLLDATEQLVGKGARVKGCITTGS